MNTVKCPLCGEDYSVTYKRCPFCEEQSAPRGSRNGGRRVANNTRGGGYGRPRSNFMRIFALLLSLVLIVAAICIVVSLVKTLLDAGRQDDPDSSSTPGVTQPGPGGDDGDGDGDGDGDDGDPAALPGGSTPGGPGGPDIPSVPVAASFTLNKTDFTLFRAGETFQMKATFSPAGATGDVVWSSSNANVASISADGLVTAAAKGTATITATMGDVSKTCIVRCNITESAPPAVDAPAASSGEGSGGSAGEQSSAFTLNRDDFTLPVGESFQLSASNAPGSVVWSIGNTSVATVSDTGRVTAVAPGSTTITASSGGVKVTCIVRVKE